MIKYLLATAAGLVAAIALRAQTTTATGDARGITFEADSARYSARYADEAYSATIGYVLRNRGRTSLSSNYCYSAPVPVLEKELGDKRWVAAYQGVTLTCKVDPPFRIAPGDVYRGVLRMVVARPEARQIPRLLVDSIQGTYRLHWRLLSGSYPDAASAPVVDLYSTAFQLVSFPATPTRHSPPYD
jgi:hypothetical protein